jgi:hypothetical protein
MAVGYIGLFFGKLIKQAVSRQREFLADASAVQFTRNPEGLSSALKRIAGWSGGSEIKSATAEEISHFFFADGLKKNWLSSMLSTHPPLAERIARLDPSFDKSTLPQVDAHHTANDSEQIAALTDSAAVDATPQSVIASVGTTEPEHFFYDDAVVAEIPADLRDAFSSSLGAVAVTYSLLLDQDPANRRFQLDLLKERVEPAVMTEVLRVFPSVLKLDNFARLPTLDIAMPALRSISEDQYDAIVGTLEMLVASDKHLTLFEFAVKSIVTTRLATHFNKNPTVSYRIGQKSLREDSQVLLSALARIGHGRDARGAESAFEAGAARLSYGNAADFKIIGPDASQIERAIARLAQVPYPSRQLVVDACAYCVLSDNEVTIDEAELLRVVIVALGCPLPPFLPRIKS